MARTATHHAHANQAKKHSMKAASHAEKAAHHAEKAALVGMKKAIDKHAKAKVEKKAAVKNGKVEKMEKNAKGMRKAY